MNPLGGVEGWARGAGDLAADAGAIRAALEQARGSQDWVAMARHAAALRAADDASGDGYFFGAMALMRLEDFDGAYALARSGLEKFPTHRRLTALIPKLAQYPFVVPARAPDGADAAVSPEAQAALRHAANRAAFEGNWLALARHATELRTRLPDDPLGYVHQCVAARRMNYFRQADRLTAAAVERFPDVADLVEERAKALHRRTEREGALTWFRRLIALAPDRAIGWTGASGELIMLGRFDEAEALLVEGLARLPDNHNLLVNQILCARSQMNLALARERLAYLDRLLPNSKRVANLAASLVMAESAAAAGGKAELSEIDTPDDTVSVGAEGGDATDDAAAILRRFESLGENCEFGLVQRACGLEPLGLLRFSVVRAADLAAMLEARFEDVGSPASTRLSLNPSNEYMLEDPRFFRTHTFLYKGVEAEDVLFGKLCKRTAFLRDKIVKEIQQGRKFFLYQTASGRLAEPMVARLHAGLRAIGPATLVCVGHDGSREITARQVDAGLVVATLPGVMTQVNLNLVRGARTEDWVALCRAVLACVG